MKLKRQRELVIVTAILLFERICRHEGFERSISQVSRKRKKGQNRIIQKTNANIDKQRRNKQYKVYNIYLSKGYTDSSRRYNQQISIKPFFGSFNTTFFIYSLRYIVFLQSSKIKKKQNKKMFMQQVKPSQAFKQTESIYLNFYTFQYVIIQERVQYM